MNLSTVKWAQWDKTQSRELLVLFICVCSSLCTLVAHNTAQNRPDNFPSCPPDNHHCFDDVYLREGGLAIHSLKFANLLTLMMSFDDTLTRANFSFVYFLQFYLLNFFWHFSMGGFEPPKPPSGYATVFSLGDKSAWSFGWSVINVLKMSLNSERTDICPKICPAFPWMYSMMVWTPLLLEDSSIG